MGRLSKVVHCLTGEARLFPSDGWMRRTCVFLASAGIAAVVSGCDNPTSVGSEEEEPRPFALVCDLELAYLSAAASFDGIRSIDEPVWALADAEVPGYLDPDTRIIGITTPTEQFAVPHNVLWHHEILNMTAGNVDLAVTYCPLTGSSLAFDRSVVDGAAFGVSGLLFMNNLVMFLRDVSSVSARDSRFSQMLSDARCGGLRGTRLPQWPITEMRWADWYELYPFTWVLHEDQGFIGIDDLPLSYEADSYPYGNYELTNQMFKPFAAPALDPRRHAKERVLGVPSSPSDPGIAFPFGDLHEPSGALRVVEFSYEGHDAIVLWDAGAKGGMAFRKHTQTGHPVTIVITEAGFEDLETGSRWSVDGVATDGPHRSTGERLEPLERAHVAFWGAWSAFHPETRLWEG